MTVPNIFATKPAGSVPAAELDENFAYVLDYPASGIAVGTSPIADGDTSSILYDNAGVLGEIATGNDGLLVTNGSGVPSIGTAIPDGVTATTQALSDDSTKLATTAWAQPRGGSLTAEVIMFEGASVMQGSSLGAPLVNGGRTGNWGDLLVNSTWAGGAATYYNDAVGGTTSAQAIARYTTGNSNLLPVPAPHDVSPNVMGYSGRGIFSIQFDLAYNDFSAGISQADSITNFQTLVSMAQADGWYIVLVTSPISTLVGSDTPTQARNRALRLAAVNQAARDGTIPSDMVADAATWIPNQADTTYYFDTVHPNANGHRVMAENAIAGFQSGGFPINYSGNYYQAPIVANAGGTFTTTSGTALTVNGADASNALMVVGASKALGVQPSANLVTLRGLNETATAFETIRLDGAVVSFAIEGVEKWRVHTDFNLLALTDNTYDIGAVAANRPRNLYLGSNLVVGGATGSAKISGADATYVLKVVGDSKGIGVLPSASITEIRGINSAATTFEHLRLGGSVVSFAIDGVEKWRVQSDFNFLATTDNTYDIGAAGANRPRNLYLGSDLLVGGVITGPVTVSGADVSNVMKIIGVTKGVRFVPQTTHFDISGINETASGFQPLRLTGSILSLGIGGAEIWRIDASGNFISAGDNLYDIGASGTNRPRDLFLAGNISVGGTAGLSGALTVTSNSASSLAVGRLGATTPAFAVDSATGSQVAGFKITGAVTGGTVALVATDSGSDTSLTFNAKGTGTIGIGSVSTGRVTITPVTTITGALTLSSTALVYDAKTLTGSTGTGNMVLSAAPTFTGAITAASATFSSTITSTLGTITDPASAYTFTATWNDAADTFYGIFGNVTNTNSHANSRVIDLQVGSASVFSVATSGALRFSGNLISALDKNWQWSGRAVLASPADGQINLTANSTTTGIGLDVGTDGTLKVRVRAQNAYGNMDALTYKVSGTQVVGARVTGYTAMTGSPDKATAYATGSVTLAQLAGRVAQLQADLTTHGLIGA